MSQKLLAALTDISYNTLQSRITKDRLPDAKDSVKIAQILDVSVEHLVTGVKNTINRDNDNIKERAENVRKRNYWTKYGEQARNVLNALLDKYAETGIENIEDMKVLTVEPLKDLGTPSEIVNIFGGKQNYLAALKELEDEIYKAA
ncbi:MAG: helix-turn-helix domain-containing protein [Treponemataceae bacterium]|nr:helix-turn-helix domain-containing protein [Treponemataceae bacterium]